MSKEKTETVDKSAKSDKPDMPEMKVEVTKEHKWLQQFVGQWSFETECMMGPGGESMKSTGTVAFRGLGELWLVGEHNGKDPMGDDVISLMSIGYDPAQKCFVGTFIASCMTHMWIYEKGVLDGNVLTLNAKGPNMMKPGEMSDYQDIVEYISADHHTLKSRLKTDDGKWVQFMEGHYKRTGK